MHPSFDSVTKRRIEEWLQGPYDAASKEEIRRLLKEDPKALSDAFFKTLSFGTGGMRGVMGVGTNRMNIYTIRRATKGLANYIQKQGLHSLPVFIGYDSRINSKLFAQEAACVLAGSKIQVRLTQDICPTPLVSFGCRHFGCVAAIMITASHNPPQYNGYKVYWSDGAQVVPPHDTGIIHEVEHLSQAMPETADLFSPFIQKVGDELINAYLGHVAAMQLYPKLKKDLLKIVYSPLHGTGIKVLPRAFALWGFSSVSCVEEQSSPDGHFPKAPSPNPEDKNALKLGTQQLLSSESDLFIATDPDADRIGVVLKDGSILSGNQVGCLLLDHIGSALGKQGNIPPHAAAIKTIVTTELFPKIARKYGLLCVDVLTGFKYIGEKIREWEEAKNPNQYLFGAEESCGYLFRSFVRDKDAISSACLIAEAAALAKSENTTLLDRLYQLYTEHGLHREGVRNIQFSDSLEGMQDMNATMQKLRQHPPTTIGGKKVSALEDYQHGFNGLPPSDVIRLWLEDESKLVIRPSGTEPKLKIYGEIVEKASSSLKEQILQADKRLQAMLHDQVLEGYFTRT